MREGGPLRGAAPYLLLGVALLVLALVVSLPDRGALQIELHSTAVRVQNDTAGGSSSTAGSTHQRRVGTLPPGTLPMMVPSKEAYKRVQADPALLETDAELLRQFEATPWLLPPRTKAFAYTGVHDLAELAALRATREGRVKNAVTLLTFNPRFSTMAQNAIFSMVKFGGVRNYLVGIWEPTDLDACADLNLPCADVSAYLPERLDHASSGEFGTHDYFVITWLSSFLVRDLLKKGYAVHYSDADIVYTVKPVWTSYLTFIEEAEADAAFQVELGSSNYVVLPTPGSIAMFEGWTKGFQEGLEAKENDQQYVERIHDKILRRCTAASGCIKAREEMQANSQTGKLALIRAYHHGYFMYSNDHCELAHADTAPLFDTCDWSILYFHPVCTDYDGKRASFVKQQMWFVNEDRCLPRNGTASQVKACEPVRWEQPDYEQHLYSCPRYSLALTHSRPAARADGT
ncbi:hypothetical protein COHA_008192 [Chlorella ohadii]|uniref:Nucleotide-diphospho-sugar transferase domain-containing protein n=1 Tax=Chlorella ohadii TaxID=2649997 RepID=A0AAD5H2Q5_9CHLO|nr:hypothetical protein COHA_008192 [Chlorella ohadii]